MNYIVELEKDIRFREGLNACLNCGICTAICPAAEFYNYDPRLIVTTVQQKDNAKIEELLCSETIWYCGQCMSCKTRCPRGNTPGFIIQALRYLSQKTGLFIESEKGRQQYAIKKTVGENILNKGYCIHPDLVAPEMHPEQGPIWKWVCDNKTQIYERLHANFDKDGPGTLRKIHQKNLDELSAIFNETGGIDLYETIEKFSENQARKMNLSFNETKENEYFNHVFATNNGTHSSE